MIFVQEHKGVGAEYIKINILSDFFLQDYKIDET